MKPAATALTLQAPSLPSPALPTGKPLKSYSPREEKAHALTHGLGVLLAVIGTTVLMTLGVLFGDGWHLVAYGVYGMSLVSLYLASTLYHSATEPELKWRLKIADHAAIYLLIGGTLTPFFLLGPRDTTSLVSLGVGWGVALFGAAMKVGFPGRFKALGIGLYLTLGWLGATVISQARDGLPSEVLWWLFGGGGFYTVGVGFYLWHRLKYHHAIWHLFVLGGSVCHYLAVALYLTPTG